MAGRSPASVGGEHLARIRQGCLDGFGRGRTRARGRQTRQVNQELLQLDLAAEPTDAHRRVHAPSSEARSPGGLALPAECAGGHDREAERGDQPDADRQLGQTPDQQANGRAQPTDRARRSVWPASSSKADRPDVRAAQQPDRPAEDRAHQQTQHGAEQARAGTPARQDEWQTGQQGQDDADQADQHQQQRNREPGEGGHLYHGLNRDNSSRSPCRGPATTAPSENYITKSRPTYPNFEIRSGQFST